METIIKFTESMGFTALFNDPKIIIMLVISFVLLYLAIVKQFEPLLLLPIAFGMLLTNLPGAEMYHSALFEGGHVHWEMFGGQGDITPGLIDYLYLGVKLGIYHEGAYNKEGKKHCYEAAQTCFKDGKDYFPDCYNNLCCSPPPVRSSIGRLSYAR